MSRSDDLLEAAGFLAAPEKHRKKSKKNRRCTSKECYDNRSYSKAIGSGEAKESNEIKTILNVSLKKPVI